MGAVFIYKENSFADIPAVLDIFKQKGFDEPIEFSTFNYKILLYKKILIENKNYITESEYGLFSVGTFIYKGLNAEESLKEAFSDLRLGKFDRSQINGSFLLIYKSGEELTLILDDSRIQNLFVVPHAEIISTSFLACALAVKNVTVNKNAAIEILTSGSLIGPDTLFNEISRIESGVSISGINLYPFSEEPLPPTFKGTYSEAVDEQISVLDNYFNSIKGLADISGVDSGITGGHDSRLIMVMALKHLKNVSYNTHWRNNSNIEFNSAIELCKQADVKLNIVKVTDPIDMSEDVLENNLNNAFLFYDGLVRMHSFWIEEYNTKNYRLKVLSDKRLGFSGIGGEQYRNEERMNRSSWKKKEMIRYKIFEDCIECFTGSDSSFEKMVEYVEKKINNKLSWNKKDSLSHIDYKLYLNKVFIPSRLGVRNNAENQISYFLSPFTDPAVSKNAYSIVNKLGPSLAFEEKMICRVNPIIASINSDHGFDFCKGEPISGKIKSYILDNLPWSFLSKYYKKRTANLSSLDTFKQLIERSQKLKEGFLLLKKLNLPLNYDEIAKKADLMPLILGMAFMMYKMKKRFYSYE